MISCMVTAQLIFTFVFEYTKSRLSHAAAYMILVSVFVTFVFFMLLKCMSLFIPMNEMYERHFLHQLFLYLSSDIFLTKPLV